MVASAFPLAEVAREAAERRDAEARARDAVAEGPGAMPDVADLPFSTPREGSTTPPGATHVPRNPDGSSSRPGATDAASQDRASASGSVLLNQVMGAAQMMGYDVAVPPLPLDRIPAEQPLRAAILAWIAATGAVVPPEELARELLRADALPLDIQRDIALLVFSTLEASALQRAALSALSPQELAWIYSHPDVAEDLARGLNTPETRALALMASQVDMEQSVAATLLLLQAVEATRPTFEEHAAKRALADLDAPSLDATTRAMLQLLATAESRASDADKVRLAAELVALGAGIPVPEPGPAPTFAQAVDDLLAASHQVPAPGDLTAVLARADLLPADLQAALARIVSAEARAIQAANPLHLTPTSQHEALAAMLVATAEALPTLQKYHVFWRDAPDALRVSEWDAGERVGWAAHHAAMLATTRGGMADLARAGTLATGRALPAVAAAPERSFVDAYVALAQQGGFPVTPELRAQVEEAGARLDPAVRDAAAILMSGAAESARLQRLAYANLTQDEVRFLQMEAVGLDGLYASPTITQGELDRLSRRSALAERVDGQALAASGIVAAMATEQAKRLLEGAGALSAQGRATPVETGLLSLLKRLLPIGSARAQELPSPDDCGANRLPVNTCGDDVVLRIEYPLSNGLTPAETVAYMQMPKTDEGITIYLDDVTVSTPAIRLDGRVPPAYTCDEQECVLYGGFVGTGEAATELLLITGTEGTTHAPQRTSRAVCPASFQNGAFVPVLQTCRQFEVSRYGAPTISIDLGGADSYLAPRAMVHNNATIPVSIHLDVAGGGAGTADSYFDPSTHYDHQSPLLRWLGEANGHPTQASAVFGGVAILSDASGDDFYVASTRSQGFGRLGLGMLVDADGADIYRARTLAQGATSDSITLGVGVLADRDGRDSYTADGGMGFGLGGLFLDAGGDDRYANDDEPYGLPVVRLDILPGGNLTVLDERDDGRTWFDGPGSIHLGIGLDTETVGLLGTDGHSDSDGYPDFVEFLFGTDPANGDDNPGTNPGARVRALSEDTDGDGYPDYVERALSTDPNNAASYPAGFPSGPGIIIPGPVKDVLVTLGLQDQIDDDTLNPFTIVGDSQAAQGYNGSDKIVDLRLPLQDAGSIDYACTGEWYWNGSAPLGLMPGQNVFSPLTGDNGLLGEQSASSTAPAREGGRPNERCAFVSYQPTGPGEGNATVPEAVPSTADYDEREEFTYRMPAGILAIGDVIATQYDIDYFVVIDLGGHDAFANAAGGGLLVQTTPRLNDGEEANTDGKIVNNTFVAPSFVANIDLSGSASPAGALLDGDFGERSRNDIYRNASRDFAHGSYFGVLLDNAGNDVYHARHGSQGALGGILLDLDGTDEYAARHLSQGAGLASEPRARDRYGDLPQNGVVPKDSVNGGASAAGVRRALPGILLDMGDHTVQTFSAGANSQGFARGFAPGFAEANVAGTGGNATNAFGILATTGGGDLGMDLYQAGRFAQGVAGLDGVGILLDREGRDTYHAGSRVSQGATISQRVYVNDPAPSQLARPATGLLLDLHGVKDTYKWTEARAAGTRTDERHMNTTLTRSETAQTNLAARIYADAGIHIDTNADDAHALISGIGGAGDDGWLDPATGEPGFHVNLPTARLAIGKNGTTHYQREYAFVVDLGGNNSYDYSAGGFLRDLLVQAPPSSPTAGQYNALTDTTAGLSLFPVTFLLDAGPGNSTYRTRQSLAQGAGFFSVGLVADLGGRDTFLSEPTPLEGHKSTWATTPPIIDGTIGGDWDFVEAEPITLVSVDDARFDSTWQMRLANDEGSLYLALSGWTTSTGNARLSDELTVSFDMGRRQVQWDHGANRTGIDQVRFVYDAQTQKCAAQDWGFNRTKYDPDNVTDDNFPSLVAQCRFTDQGEVFFEMRKDLVEGRRYDPRDLGYCHVDAVGFGYRTLDAAGEKTCVFPATELGMQIRFNDTGAGHYAATGSGSNTKPVPVGFVWPAGTTHLDGSRGHLRNANLTDEMRSWAAIGLGNLGEDGKAPVAYRAPSLAQGAGVAGVGVLAMLGTGMSEADLFAGDRAQAYGAFGGLGVLFDAGGSDRYVGTHRVQGAAENFSLALFFDATGHDNYVSTNNSLGWSPSGAVPGAGSLSAIFLDLGGDDEYARLPTQATANVTQARNAGQATSNVSEPIPAGNNIAWVQNTSVGADYDFKTSAHKVAAGVLAQNLYGQTRTVLQVTRYDPGSPGPWGNGCTDQPVPSLPPAEPGAWPKYVATGKVCLVATVDTGNGTVHESLNRTLRTLGQSIGETPDKVAAAALPRSPSGVPPPANSTINSTAETLEGAADAGANASRAPAGAGNDTIVGAQENTSVTTEDPAGGTVDVQGVDFLFNRQRVTTAVKVQQLTNTTSVWAAPIDVGDRLDGVVRAKALPIFVANVSDYGVFLFHDDVSDSLTDGAERRSILISNPPKVHAALDPDYAGRANATYSSKAYGAEQTLWVNYSITPDAAENMLAAYNSFEPPLWNKSLPCRGVPTNDSDPALCDLLTFYLPTDTSAATPMTTTPGADPVNTTRNIMRESPSTPQTRFTPVLGSELRILRDQSFHLALPERTSLNVVAPYYTTVLISLTEPNNNELLDDNGQIWYLAEETERANASSTTGINPGPIFGSARSVVEKAQGTVDNQLKQLEGNVVYNLEQQAMNTTCATSALTCDQLNGRYGMGQLRGCTPAPSPNNLLALVVWTAFNAADNAIAGVAKEHRICRPLGDDINKTAQQVGSHFAGVTDDAAKQLRELPPRVVELAEGALSGEQSGERNTSLNWTDFFFDVNQTLPEAVRQRGVRFEGDTLVVPPGLKLKLQIAVRVGAGQAVYSDETSQDIRNLSNTYAEQVDSLNALFGPVIEDIEGAAGREILYNLHEPRRGLNVTENVTSVPNAVDANGRNLNGLTTLSALPPSFFYAGAGDPDYQARLEIRRPVTPSTNVEILVQDVFTGEVAAVLKGPSGVTGDVPGTPTRDDGKEQDYTRWEPNETNPVFWKVNRSNRTWTQHSLGYNDPGLPDGIYYVNTSAVDAAGNHRYHLESLIIDSTPPVTRVTTDAFVGDATLMGSKIPIRWVVDERGAGVRSVYLWVRNGTDGDIANPQTWGERRGPYASNIRFDLADKNASVDQYAVMVIAVDEAGNVEGTENEPDLETALAKAFEAKIALGSNVPHGYRVITLDEGEPLFSSLRVDGGRFLNHQGSDFTFVRSGEVVRFAICARDLETGIGLVNISLDHVDPATGNLTTATFTAARGPACDGAGALFINDTWHLVNHDSTRYPEGIWELQFEVFDKAGNRIRVPGGRLILDHASPTVRLEPPVLPVGQTAVKPGDTVKLRLIAHDDFGVDEAGIRVDASALAKNASAIPMRPVRINGIIYQEASFVVDREGLDNRVYQVAVHVPDLAGNATVLKADIAVNYKPFDFVPGSLRVTNVTHNSLVLHWKTTENTSALVKFGTTPIALNGRTPQDLNATLDHSVKVEGLQPSTRYHLRAVAVSTGGLTKESPVIEAETGTALFLEAVSPKNGDRVSGAVPIKFRGGLLDSTDFVTYTLEVRDDPGKPWTFVTTATRGGERHELTWNSTRFLDGTTYQLRLTAEAGRDVASLVIGPLVSDNTPPSVLVLAPLLATNDTTPALAAEAGDALSGFGAEPVQLLIDGKPAAANLSVESVPGGRIRISAAMDAPLAQGIRAFELRVQDRAGNVAKETWKVAIDGEAPVVTVEPTRYAPGTAAAKLGGTVTLNLTIKDLSGVSLVVADTSALSSSSPETRLVKLVNTENWQGTFPVTAGDASATKPVPIRATDLAGNIRELEVQIPVDNLAPDVAATALVAATHTRAMIEVPANEPILVNGTATAPLSPPVTAATRDAEARARLTFDGLLPSRTYTYKLSAVDRAGNAVDLTGTFATQKDVLPPTTVGALSVLDLLNGTLRLSWGEALDDVAVSHYRVYRSDDGVTFTVVAEVKEPSYDDAGLPYEKPYVYKVAAVDYGGNEGPADERLRAAATAVPTLTVGAVTPTVGTTGTTFRYVVTYLSPGGVAPAYVRVILNGVPQNMTLQSGDATTGAIYVYETRLAPHKRDEPHTYSFEAFDGRYTARFPGDGGELRGPLVSGDILAGGEAGGFASFAQRVPLGGVAGVALALVAAVGIAAALGRRKKEGSK